MANQPTSGEDDLPPAPGQPRDPATGKFAPLTPQEPAKPQHNPYMLAKAQQYGIDVSADLSPEALGQMLALADRLSSRQPQAQPQKPAPEPEPVVDWGKHDDGRPMTEADYAPPVARAIRAEAKLAQLEKKLGEQDQRWQQAEMKRAEQEALRQIHSVLATRPDLFGDSPGDAAPGTPEAERYELAAAYIQRLLQTNKATTPKADAQRALALFGQQAKPKPGVNPAVQQYRQAETARTTGRRPPMTTDRRQLLIEQKAAELRENGSVAAVYSDDDDDLPDAPKG